MFRPQGGLFRPQGLLENMLKFSHVCAYIHFLKRRTLVFHHIHKGISDPEAVENHLMVM